MVRFGYGFPRRSVWWGIVLFPLVAAVAARSVWALDIPENVWVSLRPTVELPSGVSGVFDERNLTKMIYAGSSGRFLSWDGFMDEGLYPPTIYSNAIWSYDVAGNTLRLEKRNNWHNVGGTEYTTVPLPENADDPTPADRHPYGYMAYVPDKDAVYVWGGANRTISPSGRHPEDTWAYQVGSNTWTNLDPPTHPLTSLEGAFAYDSDAKKLVMFGGDLESAGRTWLYDVTANTWTEVELPAGSKPSPRMGHAMVYDPVRKRTLLFGGGPWPEGGNDLWSFDSATNRWTELTPVSSPPIRKAHGFAYDSTHDIFLLYGGRNRSISEVGNPLLPLSDTWVYLPQEQRWEQLTPLANPSGSPIAVDMDYDPVNQMFIAHFQGAWWAYRYRRSAGGAPDPEPNFETVIHTVETGGGGAYTDVVLDSQGYPHVSHTSLHENTDRDSLRYSRWTGTGWLSQCVDRTGAFTSITLDRQGRPHIAYTNPDWTGARADGGLYYAVLDGTWTIQQLQPELGWIARDSSIQTDSQDRPHIAYYHTRTPDVRIVDNLHYAFFDGAWHFELVKDTNADRDQVGKWNSLLLDGSDRPTIAFFDRVGNRDGATQPAPPPTFNHGLSVAVRNETGWSTQLIDSVTQTQDNGYGVATTRDSTGVRHFSYFNADDGELKYLRDGFGPEVVARVAWANSERLSRGLVKTSIAVNPDGIPIISFTDFDEAGNASTARLKLAYKIDGVWRMLDVDTGGVGPFAAMAMTRDGHLAISYYDYVRKDLKVAFLIDRNVAPAPVQPFGSLNPTPTPSALTCKSSGASDEPPTGGGSGDPPTGGSGTDGDSVNLAQGFFGCGTVSSRDGWSARRSAFGAHAADMALLLLVPGILGLRGFLRTRYYRRARGLTGC